MQLHQLDHGVVNQFLDPQNFCSNSNCLSAPPPLRASYAPGGRVSFDLEKRPLGQGTCPNGGSVPQGSAASHRVDHLVCDMSLYALFMCGRII
jgi:hypothetical protein